MTEYYKVLNRGGSVMISKAIGFTGTRKGMTLRQKRELRAFLVCCNDAYSGRYTMVFHQLSARPITTQHPE